MSEREYLIAKALRMPKIGAKKKPAAFDTKALDDFMAPTKPNYATPSRKPVTFDKPKVSLMDRPKPVGRPKRTREGTPAQYDAAGIPRRSRGDF